MQKPSIPKGTRDFTPVEMVRREFIFDTIRQVFRKYGYSPIETPAMENLSTLLGKYGEEGDKLLFKILNSGDYLSNSSFSGITANNYNKFALEICEKGLRYDLTVPFARYVVQHLNEIVFPFKRYQIQPVWRADRPQKGRYREFYQCDADIIGSDSLLNELELLQIIDEVYRQLNIDVTIQLNNRKILAGIAEIIEQPNSLTDITVAIDKIDKIGIENVIAELRTHDLPETAIDKLKPFLSMKEKGIELITHLKKLLEHSATGLKGLEELERILNLSVGSTMSTRLEFNLTLARGLNYYTGAIIEVKANDVQIGSICGGGRYDNLTGIFGLPDVSGVGISFGADRIYDVMDQLKLFPPEVGSATKLLLVNFGEKEQGHCLTLLKQFREAGISAELYPDSVKLKKQMSYADAREIPYVLLVGEQEILTGLYTLKNMSTSEQKSLSFEGLVKDLG
jgi:histidyl-tRNA synthetase